MFVWQPVISEIIPFSRSFINRKLQKILQFLAASGDQKSSMKIFEPLVYWIYLVLKLNATLNPMNICQEQLC